ncbi:MAG: hypothetical protein ACEQSK_04045 [Sphingomonadaceae bacterium]
MGFKVGFRKQLMLKCKQSVHHKLKATVLKLSRCVAAVNFPLRWLAHGGWPCSNTAIATIAATQELL